MKAWIQRVNSAKVEIEGHPGSSIGRGFMILFSVTHTDTPAMAERLAARTAKLRLFEDSNGKTNLSLADIGGCALVVSQFTLYADTRHGNRPGFSAAARPEKAIPLYELFVKRLKDLLGEDRVKTGRFGAYMKVSLENDGPFSVELAEDPPSD
ncbi:MAG: D-tyrosyl-tRNA(Tyr) deacylase [Kiritimatiellae bacterium]|nr:D-tyrosyl-tRNA(Tyr) deacylase [Kiritimatiellia bacterium]